MEYISWFNSGINVRVSQGKQSWPPFFKKPGPIYEKSGNS